MEYITVFFQAFASVLFVFFCSVMVLYSWKKRLRAIHTYTISLTERRLEGTIGILKVLALFAAISPIAYTIAGSTKGAEAVFIISGLFFVPFLLFAVRILWYSISLLVIEKNNSHGGKKTMDQHTTCPMPDSNPATQEITEILQNSHTIAVVGLSDNSEKDSNRVARYLIEKGYNVIPVNPHKQEILGRTCYPDLTSIPEKIDVVDIFRPVEAIPPIVDEAIRVGAKVVWMQQGLAHPDSAKKARKAGLKVIQSKCIKVEHSKIFSGSAGISFNIR